MKLLLLVLLLVPNLSFSYSTRDISLSDYEYNRYVRTGLRDIVKEYFALYQSLNPEIQNSYTQFKIHSEIRDSFQKANKLKEVESIFKELEKIKIYSRELLKENSKRLVFKDKEFFPKNEILKHYYHYEIYKKNIFDFYLVLDSYELLTSMVEVRSFINEKIKLHSILEAKFFIFLNNTSDVRFKRAFAAFENDFVRPIQKYVFPATDKKNFIARINQFNLAITKLNVALTKRNKNISKQSKSLIKTYHTRWNNILKVTLRR
jgi:hypothetical protein